jgi:hypothetical protein
MHIDRAHADRYLAFLGFALSFLFLLVIVALRSQSRRACASQQQS